MRLFNCPKCGANATDYTKFSDTSSFKEKISIVGKCSHCNIETVMDFKVLFEAVLYMMIIGLVFGYYYDFIKQLVCEIWRYFENEQLVQCDNLKQPLDLSMFVLTFVLPLGILNLFNRRLYKVL